MAAQVRSPVVPLLEAILVALLRPGESADIRLTPSVRALAVELRASSSKVAGVLIGRDGETITAIRHLVSRAGKAQQPPVLVLVEVTVEEV